jgi:hypothetical protein
MFSGSMIILWDNLIYDIVQYAGLVELWPSKAALPVYASRKHYLAGCYSAAHGHVTAYQLAAILLPMVM